jgi:hypothetical protein
VLLDFEGAFGFAQAGNVELDGEGVVNAGEVSGKFDVNDGADDLDDFAFVHYVFQFGCAEREANLWRGREGVKDGVWVIFRSWWRGWFFAAARPGRCLNRQEE